MWVSTELDPDTHAMVAEYAAKRGVRISAAVAELIANALEMQEEDTPRYRLWRAMQKARQKMQDLVALQQIASALDTSSADEQNQFVALCNEFGFDENEILRSASNIDFQTAQSETILRAIALLRGFLERHGGEASATIAERELLAAGLSHYAINRARRALNVVSTRGKHGFIWKLPEKEEK